MAAGLIFFLVALGAAVPAKAASQAMEKRTTLALTLREGQSTEVDMIGVGLAAGRMGEADMKRQAGRTRIKLRMEALPNPQSLGSLYTAYLLWAVAPEGRAESLAELPHSKGFDLEATTSFPTFGLVITAEPDALVAHPGALLVAENGVRGSTRGRLQGGSIDYVASPEQDLIAPGPPDFRTPLALLGARRAVELAKAAGASQYAGAELREAEVKLAALEQTSIGKEKLSKDAEIMARDVMRLAEHARVLTADRLQAATQAAERRAAQALITNAQTEAQKAAAQAERDRERAARAREEAERAEQDAIKARATMQQAQSDAEHARASEELARAEAERARSSEDAARMDADRARLEAQQAQQDKVEMQERLFQSLSAILETRREARGLIVNLSDVLFDFDRASLKPGAREKLSKLAGILLAYPGPYNIEIEGHTDSIGTHEYNLRLSRDRAESVSSYLMQAGIPTARITRVTGFGETRPVASNDNAAGRQMNRRVELVITDLES